jgi:hypothetical protein
MMPSKKSDNGKVEILTGVSSMISECGGNAASTLEGAVGVSLP